MTTKPTGKTASPTAATLPHGRFIWYDLMTSDPEGAQRFYKKIAGWGTQDWEGGPSPYTMWTNDGAPIGGMIRLPQELIAQGVPPHWLPYICVRDVDETLRRAEQLGGKPMREPEDIPTVGRFAVLADPQGAVFSIYTPAGDVPGHEGEPSIGDMSWHELATTDYRNAFAFYQKLFDWDETDAFDMGDGWMYQMYGQHGAMYGGVYDKPKEMEAPPHWLCYIHVRNAQQAVEQVKKLGGQVLNGPMEVPGGDMVAQCLDPQGAAFAVHAKKQ